MTRRAARRRPPARRSRWPGCRSTRRRRCSMPNSIAFEIATDTTRSLNDSDGVADGVVLDPDLAHARAAWPADRRAPAASCPVCARRRAGRRSAAARRSATSCAGATRSSRASAPCRWPRSRNRPRAGRSRTRRRGSAPCRRSLPHSRQRSPLTQAGSGCSRRRRSRHSIGAIGGGIVGGGERVDARVGAADGAAGVRVEADGAEASCPRIILEEAPDESGSFTAQQPRRLDRLAARR